MSGSSVLYDVPGPRAKRLNVLLTVGGVLLLVGLVVLVVLRLAATGQLTAARWEPFLYVDIQRALADGLLATLRVAAVATVLALAMGAVLAAGRLSDHAWLRGLSTVLVEVPRSIPVLLLIFFFFFFGSGAVSPYWSVVLGLTLYNGSVLAEVLRAGVLSLPSGQAEAAYALGLRKTAVMRLVLVPQAVRAMMPSIVAQVVVVLKDSSLGFLVAYAELLRTAQQIGSQFFNIIPTFIVAAAMYITVNLLVAGLATWLERRLRRAPGRRRVERAEEGVATSTTGG